MITKESILKTLKDMPEEINVDELLYKLVLLQKIEDGLQQSDKGQTISTEQLKSEVRKWQQK